MKSLFIALALLLTSLASHAQTASKDSANDDYDKVFTKVEKEAVPLGGYEGWKNYLQKHLKANVATKAGLPVGVYKVAVVFIVKSDGSISDDIKVVESSKCIPCTEEAKRVILQSPKWEPAMINGRSVNFYASQAISFQVSEK